MPSADKLVVSQVPIQSGWLLAPSEFWQLALFRHRSLSYPVIGRVPAMAKAVTRPHTAVSNQAKRALSVSELSYQENRDVYAR